MTKVSDRIKDKLSYDIIDWKVTASEEKAVVGYLDGDHQLEQTVQDLGANGLRMIFNRLESGRHLSAIQILAARAPGKAQFIRRVLTHYVRNDRDTPRWLGGEIAPYFDICKDLGSADRKISLGGGAGPIAPKAYTGGASSAAFSGVGATGTNPATLSIGIRDKYRLWDGHKATVAKYSNPLIDLAGYLRSLTAAQRLGQAKQLVKQRISTLFPYAYAGGAPLRTRVLALAGTQHRLEPELISAFILAEQRDQSKLEDAKDYTAAMSFLKGNTSIGLGQVVVSTARTYELFLNLLTSVTSARLTHRQIATLLASDEYNIFATAKYIRLMADRASGMSIASLPKTKSHYPAIDLVAFSRHSKDWPTDNVLAMASEYTSKPWDDSLRPYWADFVGQAYRTYKASGIAFK